MSDAGFLGADVAVERPLQPRLYRGGACLARIVPTATQQDLLRGFDWHA